MHARERQLSNVQCLGCDNLVMPGVSCAVVDDGYRLIEKVMQP